MLHIFVLLAPLQQFFKLRFHGTGKILHECNICRGQQYSPRGRGAHVQTMTPRLPNADRGGTARKPRAARGAGRGGRGAWTQCGPEIG